MTLKYTKLFLFLVINTSICYKCFMHTPSYRNCKEEKEESCDWISCLNFLLSFYFSLKLKVNKSQYHVLYTINF